MTTEVQTKAKKKSIYDWTSLHHAVSCPRHNNFDEKTLAAMVREHLRLDDKTKLPERSKWPVLPCAEVEGECCPADIVVNASNRTIIVGATGVPEVCRDTPRIDPGDRRKGDYYVAQIGLPLALGIQRVRDLPIQRLAELEKQRQVRTGDRPADWILQARDRAKRGEGPAMFADKGSAMNALQAAAGDRYLGAFGEGVFGSE